MKNILLIIAFVFCVQKASAFMLKDLLVCKKGSWTVRISPRTDNRGSKPIYGLLVFHHDEDVFIEGVKERSSVDKVEYFKTVSATLTIDKSSKKTQMGKVQFPFEGRDKVIKGLSCK